MTEVMILDIPTIGLKLLRKEASIAIREKYNPYNSIGIYIPKNESKIDKSKPSIKTLGNQYVSLAVAGYILLSLGLATPNAKVC